MSVSRVQSWRWRVVEAGNGRSRTERLVGLVLAIYMNGAGNCDPAPSINTIAAAAGIDRKLVIRTIQSLEDAGYLLVHHGRNRGGNTYSAILAAAEETVPTPARSGTVRDPGTVPRQARNGTVGGPRNGPIGPRNGPIGPRNGPIGPRNGPFSPEERSRGGHDLGPEGVEGEKQKGNSRRGKNTLALPRESEFDRFWIVWPRKVAKETARRAFGKACDRVDDVETIVVAAESIRDHPRRRGIRYIPYPATWLNRDGWEDDVDAMFPGDRDGKGTPGLRSLQVAQAAKAVGR